jgi:hypothetical protein
MESPTSGSLEPDALKVTAKGFVPLVGVAVNAATGAELIIKTVPPRVLSLLALFP